MPKRTTRAVLLDLIRLHPELQKRDGSPNQNEVARATGLPQPTISRILTGEREDLRAETVGALAKYFKVTASQIRGESPLPFDVERGKNIGPPDGQGVLGRVPLISWVQAGSWMEAVDLYPVGIGEEPIEYTVPVGPRGFALRVQGESMSPDFPEGMVIIVDPDVQPVHRSYVIARLPKTNEVTFKQLVIEGTSRYLKPLNPAYPAVPLDPDAAICGVVVEAIYRRKLV